MSSGLPNSDQEPNADAITSEAEQKAVETFTLDVSAGNRTGAAPRPKHRAKKTRAAKSLSAKKGASRAPLEVTAPAAAKHDRIRLAAAPHFSTKSAAGRPSDAGAVSFDTPAHEPTSRGRTPSWLVSLAVHAVILLLLSFFSLATFQQEDLGLWASTAPQEVVDEFAEFEIDPSLDLDSLDTESPLELEDPGMGSFGDLSAESQWSDVSSSTSLVSDNLGEWGSLFGKGGNGLSDLGAGSGGATTSFFGTQVKANRILFMLDNSGGMGREGKFETLVDELLKTVDSMQPKQQFYVIFYSDTVYPLFHPRSESGFVRATEPNKRRLREWLRTVELCMGNAIDEAIAAAEVIRPETVLLLTDGELFTTERKRSLLLDGSSRRYPIHTFGMGAEKSREYTEQLQLVAEANNGTYRAVQVSPEAVKLSRTSRRPYRSNRTGPGLVWGIHFATPTDSQ
ncbi:MAG: VWA domain-containing protein [Planctomycetes bacterium]|nr:VWA domain-containing protein [Planctomycetota bacterium]